MEILICEVDRLFNKISVVYEKEDEVYVLVFIKCEVMFLFKIKEEVFVEFEGDEMLVIEVIFCKVF